MNKRFAIITDLHYGPARNELKESIERARKAPEAIEKVITQLNQEEGIEFVVNLGDLIQDSTTNPSREDDLRNLDLLMGMLSKLKYPLYQVIGNHDLINLKPNDLKSVLKEDEIYYSFEDSEYKYIFLYCDSPKHVNVHLLPEEYDWLKSELRSSTKPIIIFMHQLLVEHPLEGTSCENMPDCAYLRNRTEVVELFANHKVVAVFNGHMHRNLFKVEKNIPFFTIQALTELVRGTSTITESYAIVDISGNTITTTVKGNESAVYKAKLPI